MTSESANPASTPAATRSMDDIVALCRRRGFIWQSSEIYGGINGFWDYGPLGTELKRNLKEAWWHDIVRCPGKGPDGHLIDMVGVDCTIIMHPKVWEASGHLAGFNDPMVGCRGDGCKKLFRADHVFVVGFVDPHQVDASKLESLKPSTVAREFIALMDEHPPRSADRVAAVAQIVRLYFHELKAALPRPYLKTVLATSAEEAMALGALTSKERSKLGELVGSAIPLVRYVEAGADDVWAPVPCPACGRPGTLTPPRQFNLMFPTYVGAVFDEENKAYLRPETAQGIFCNFWNVVDTSRVKIPFGIAQQGKAFRNEVTPRNFTFRSREFEQMEIEFFIRPDQADEWYRFWRDSRYAWWKSIGLAGDNLQLREHEKEELAHYAKEGAGVCDIEYRFPFTAPGFGELEGVAHRADFDLKAHATACGKGDKMRYFDQERNERYFPHVIEPSAGADRGTLALLCEAYVPDPSRPSGVYMKFHPRMAPIKAAIFPLVNKDGMPEVAEKLYMQLRERWAVQIDVKQTIGKRYARMDEAGTPYCFTIDGDTLKDQTVTVRHRDTLQQERIAIDKVEAFLSEKIGG